MKFRIKDKESWGKLLERVFNCDSGQLPDQEHKDLLRLRKHVVGLIVSMGDREATPRVIGRVRKMYAMVVTIDGLLQKHGLEVPTEGAHQLKRASRKS